MKAMPPLQVIYDGHCGICRASVGKIEQLFGDKVRPVDFRIVPVGEIHPELSETRCQARLHVIEQGKVYGGAEAMVRVLRLHRGWRLIVWLYYLPPLGWLAEAGYRLVASNRFRLSKWLGRDLPDCGEACSIRKPD
ncbi:putative DCC family thiol-disulfide oxidoreductase YuxK [Tumebacillus sp. BK434]|uniref:thiol-disulfide oxidoreductase DCC family protein n=1 Tax=Tumebacillus sp. BK434 TaxID=2512169 RepID=UPI0010DF9D42|nr:DUF393 domain-containing protein [Tumebacillus sp. BK434]TCP54783.1 putative DCC family thiol-disulfide oxidoreductase YuxK [Tumebacillus sp. BK434]